jgi:predicted nucleotidyltransferase
MRFEDLSTKANIGYHKQLNPAAWKDGNLHREVRLRLLTIAKIFVKYLEIPNFKVEDVVLTGSMANFNWTKFSDFDLHIVTDYDSLECDDIAEAFYNAKKRIWNDEHNITINGHEVEMYIEDSATPPVSQGIFSILNNKWISKPTFDPPKINDGAITSKANAIVQLINKSLDGDEEDLQTVIDKIYKMRQAGLDTYGEFSTENLTFKVLRNQGYLDKLHNAKTQAQDRRLSIK